MYKIENISDTLNVYISGIIDDDTCEKISKDIIYASEAGSKKLMMHINSYGGSVAGAYQLISTIKNAGISFIAQNEGFAISAAGILLASADEARAYDYSMALIHDPLMGGTTLKDTKGSDKEFLTKIKDGLMSILNRRLKMPKEQLDEMMSKETSMNADEQLSIGLVDSIISTNSKPNITKNMDIKEVWNIYEEFNKNKTKEMEIKKENEDVKVVAENKTIEAVENVVDIKAIENKLADLVIENKKLKVENFILVNKFEDKKDKIEDAVEKHGISVLDTIFAFISNIENKVEVSELKEKLEVVENKVTEIVNSANDLLDSVIVTNSTPNYEEMAEKYFGINADNSKRLELKAENIKLYNKLHDIYFA